MTDVDFVRVERVDAAHLVRLERDANLFDDQFLVSFHAALDAVEADATGDPVVTTGSGKFFSNGFDLEYLGQLRSDDLVAFIEASCELLARILTFPAPTVAAVNGHAFGIGGMLALAHDRQVMRSERGWFCLPEVDLGLGFHPFMQALIMARLPPRTAQDAMLTGRRYDGAAACAAGIVDASAPGDELVMRAMELARPAAGKQPRVVAALKAQLHAAIVATVGGR
jgi:Delta3-Delta2-enoyl-CoA isomerase